MSQLPQEALTYEVVVAEFFLGLRGGGLMLSPLDVELVQTWQRRGLPVAVVCRGLRRGIEVALEQRGPSSSPPRSLRAYRLAVEDEWTAYRRGRVGDAPAPPDEVTAARDRLDRARATLAHAVEQPGLPPAIRVAYQRGVALLCTVPTSPDLAAVDGALERADTEVVRAWLGTMTREDRSATGRRCGARAGPRAPWIPRSRHRSALQHALVEGARAAGLLCLRGSV